MAEPITDSAELNPTGSPNPLHRTAPSRPAHFLVTPTVLIWTYLRRSAEYAVARTVLASITISALLGFWLFPTAPPRLLPGSGFHDTLAAYSNWGWWSASDSAPRALASVANQFAAFPSLHVAWAA